MATHVHAPHERSTEHLTFNVATGKVRVVKQGGRTFFVAPMTTIVPGVLPGSKGPLYYPPEEVANSVKAWDGMPIVVYHPTGSNGQHLSARDPNVLSSQGVGFLRNSRFDGKLRHEGWFDAERTKQVDVRVYDALKNGRPLELSTGLYTENYLAPEYSQYQGRSYTHVAKNYVPDHLAVLPDQVGACSIADGCGVLVNAQHKSKLSVDDFKRLAVNQEALTMLHPWYTTNSNPEGHNQYTSGGGKALPKGVGRTMPGKAGEKVHDVWQSALTQADEMAHGELIKAVPGKIQVHKITGDLVHEPRLEASTSASQAKIKAALKSQGWKAPARWNHPVGSEHPTQTFRHPEGHQLVVEKLQTRDGQTSVKYYPQYKLEHFTLNASNPHHAETGKYLPHGAGTGKGNVHAAAVAGGTHGHGEGCRCPGCLVGNDDDSTPEASEEGEGSGEGVQNAGPTSGKLTRDAFDSTDAANQLTQTAKTADDHLAAAEAHAGAHQAHAQAAGKLAESRGEDEEPGSLERHHQAKMQEHLSTGSRHWEKANSAASTDCTTNHEEPEMAVTTNVDFQNDAEQKAAFAHMEESDHASTVKARAASGVATKKGTAESHAKAAKAHRAAAVAHAAAGNKALAKAHRAKAKEHAAKSKELTTNHQEGGPTMAKLTEEQREAIVDGLVANECCGWQEEDREVLNGLSDKTLTGLEEQANIVANAKKKPKDEEDDEPEMPDDVDEDKVTDNAETAWLAKAPVSIQNTIAYAKGIEQREKDQIISRMTAHLDGKKKTKVFNCVKDKHLDELQDLVLLAPTPKPVANGNRLFSLSDEGPSYLGAAAPVNNSRTSDDGHTEPIPQSVMTYGRK
jgi:hypothetical protein